MLEEGTLDATYIAEEMTTYSVKDLRLELNRDGSSLGDKISMRNIQVNFADTHDEQVEHDHCQIAVEHMYYARQITSIFDSEIWAHLR